MIPGQNWCEGANIFEDFTSQISGVFARMAHVLSETLAGDRLAMKTA
jgi:hypothetical protein